MSYDPYEIEIDYGDSGSAGCSSHWSDAPVQPACNIDGAPMCGAVDIYGDAFGSTANYDAFNGHMS